MSTKVSNTSPGVIKTLPSKRTERPRFIMGAKIMEKLFWNVTYLQQGIGNVTRNKCWYYSWCVIKLLK